MIDIDEAYERIAAVVSPLPSVRLPLEEALHRTLAEPVVCDVDFPPFDRSLMDGFAVRAADVASVPVRLQVVGQIAAGSLANDELQAGEAMQINTGAAIPRGADAVVRVEQTELVDDGQGVQIQASVPVGKFITTRASYFSAGSVALAAGTCLSPLEIAIGATCGAVSVAVHRRPRVGVLVTGDELVGIDEVPTGAKIRNSNKYLLAAMIEGAHAEASSCGEVIDDIDVLREAVASGFENDVLCITGGISMGAFDFVPEVLEELGATFHVRKMAIKPGRPIIFATAPNGCLVFALPGNPISAFVGFELLVRPALAGLEGRAGEFPRPVRGRLVGSLGSNGPRRAFRPARVAVTPDGEYEVEPLSWHGSGDVFGMSGADGLIMQPPDAGAISTGQDVSVLLFGRR